MNKKKGYTLIELIIAMALMAIIGLFVMGFMMPMMKNYNQQNKVRNAKDVATLMITYLKEEIHCATGNINTGTEGPEVYRIINDATLTRNGITSSQIKVDDFKISLKFTSVDNAIKISVVVYDRTSGAELYTLTSLASATDSYAIYEGETSNTLSLKKRTSCK